MAVARGLLVVFGLHIMGVDRNEEQHSAKSDLLQPYERYELLGSPGEGLGIDAALRF